MECGDIFKLASLPLKKLAVIAIAVHYLERPDIAIQLDDDLTRGLKHYKEKRHRSASNTGPDVLPFSHLPRNVFIYVEKQVELLPISGTLIHEIKVMVFKIWQKICHWRYYVIKKIDDKYATKIFWTSHGEIDKLKIVKDFWLRDAEFPDENLTWYNGQSVGSHLPGWAYYFMGSSLFCAALIHAKDLKNTKFEMLKVEFFKQKPIVRLEGYNKIDVIVAKWILCRGSHCEGKEKLSDYLLSQQCRAGNVNQPVKKLPAEYLFLNCVSCQFEFGVKYFWDKLTIHEKNIWVTKGAEICIRKLSGFFESRTCLWVPIRHRLFVVDVESNLKILLFLINEMTEFQKLDFIPQNFVEIFKSLCLVWPYQELCTQILYKIWHHIPVNEEEFLRSVVVTCNVTAYEMKDMLCRNRMIHYTGKIFFQHLFRTVMQVISKEAKENIFIKDDCDNLRRFYEIPDYVCLNVILNDFHLVEYRKTILEIGVDYITKMISENEYGLKEIFENMDLSKEESIWLLKKLNYFDAALLSGDMKKADELLNAISDLDIERDELKNQIDAAEFCSIFIQNNQFEMADEFLSWMFKTEVDRKNFKKSLGSEDFLMNKIFYIWSRSKLDTSEMLKNETACTNLLNFFFEPTEIQNFKETLKAKSEKVLVEYWNFLSLKSFTNFDKFLEFCLFSNDEIEAMKINIANSMDWWIDTFVMESFNFELIRDLLRWIYGNDVGKKEKVVEDYMSSAKGTLLIIKICNNLSVEILTSERIMHFFNMWITESNFSRIDTFLGVFRKTLKGIDFSVWHLLEERKKARIITEYDLSFHKECSAGTSSDLSKW